MSNSVNPIQSSWLEFDKESGFTLENIPFGIFKTAYKDARAATRIGDKVIDLSVLADFGYFDKIELSETNSLHQKTLNDFIALGKACTSKVRLRIADLFSSDNSELKLNQKVLEFCIHDIEEVEMLMPISVGDYTDFYSSIEHATNVGIMFRDPANALFPNWKHLPVGYHGRSSSIVISGTPIHRPYGQVKLESAVGPEYGPSRSMDFELEMAFVTGTKTNLGDQISVDDAKDHIFGLLIFNDLSARDIQKWEYVPLGPFLGKNFGSVISPWILTLEALDPFWVDGPKQEPEVLPYLKTGRKGNLNIDLEVYLQAENEAPFMLAHSNMKYLYWNMAQQLAHHTVNGCNVNVGDLYASGTISGPTPDSYGSMLELCWKGTKPIKLPNGTERRFIEDNDTIIMKAYAKNEHYCISFGEVTTKILPAKI